MRGASGTTEFGVAKPMLFGSPNGGVLKVLKDSIRNCSRPASPSAGRGPILVDGEVNNFSARRDQDIWPGIAVMAQIDPPRKITFRPPECRGIEPELACRAAAQA